MCSATGKWLIINSSVQVLYPLIIICFPSVSLVSARTHIRQICTHTHAHAQPHSPPPSTFFSNLIPQSIRTLIVGHLPIVGTQHPPSATFPPVPHTRTHTPSCILHFPQHWAPNVSNGIRYQVIQKAYSTPPRSFSPQWPKICVCAVGKSFFRFLKLLVKFAFGSVLWWPTATAVGGFINIATLLANGSFGRRATTSGINRQVRKIESVSKLFQKIPSKKAKRKCS